MQMGSWEQGLQGQLDSGTGRRGEWLSITVESILEADRGKC